MHKRRVRIYVTWEDIGEGEPGSPRFCPIARAAQRSTGENWRIGFGFAWVSESRREVGLSDAVKRWVLRYDEGEPVEPFHLYLPAPLSARDA
jgi:hypothetical protein